MVRHVIPDSQIIGLVEYVFGFHSCPYCHKHYEIPPTAGELSEHLLLCILGLEKEFIETPEE